MIPQHTIIEIVCNAYSVTPQEFNDQVTRKHRILHCQHLVIIALSEHTRMSKHQISELLNYDLQRIRYAIDKYRDSVPGDTINDKYNLINHNLKQHETYRLYQSDGINSNNIPDIPKPYIMHHAEVHYQCVG